MEMFFGRRQQPGFMDQMPGSMSDMGYAPQQFNPDEMMCSDMPPMGCGTEPMGYYGPGMEHVGMDTERVCPEIYVVQKGDTVYKIAQKYGLDWRTLAGYNHLGNPDLIYPGERLFIPPYCCS
jgi:hypothetical protein